MPLAWHGHLKLKSNPLAPVIFAVRGIALF